MEQSRWKQARQGHNVSFNIATPWSRLIAIIAHIQCSTRGWSQNWSWIVVHLWTIGAQICPSFSLLTYKTMKCIPPTSRSDTRTIRRTVTSRISHCQALRMGKLGCSYLTKRNLLSKGRRLTQHSPCRRDKIFIVISDWRNALLTKTRQTSLVDRSCSSVDLSCTAPCDTLVEKKKLTHVIVRINKYKDSIFGENRFSPTLIPWGLLVVFQINNLILHFCNTHTHCL